MLSRSAERVYWLGRYLERAENTARIVQQYSQLLLDLPEEVGVDWAELISIFGLPEDFGAREPDERTVVDYLLAHDDNGNALANSIRMARDNIRNARDLLPQESWECANELLQYARQNLKSASAGKDRFEVLAQCIARCQQVNGILNGTMSHAYPYHFLVIGQKIERADMTSRIIDVAAAYLQQNEAIVLRYGSTLWTNVLKSVSGFQMYRQYCKPEVTGLSVSAYLVNDRQFPRAIRACIEEVRRTATALPRGDQLEGAIGGALETLPEPIPEDFDGAAVSRLMDDTQQRLADIHQAVVRTWFLPGR